MHTIKLDTHESQLAKLCQQPLVLINRFLLNLQALSATQVYRPAAILTTNLADIPSSGSRQSDASGFLGDIGGTPPPGELHVQNEDIEVTFDRLSRRRDDEALSPYDEERVDVIYAL